MDIDYVEKQKHMKDFRKQGNHLKAMKQSREIASKIEYTHWYADKKPTWDECKEHLNRAFEKDKVKN